jgi:hypothetical protein
MAEGTKAAIATVPQWRSNHSFDARMSLSLLVTAQQIRRNVSNKCPGEDMIFDLLWQSFDRTSKGLAVQI